MSEIDRVILIVLDSFGVGHLPDAERFDDLGAHTLLHIYESMGGLDLPNLCSFGLGHLAPIGCSQSAPAGCYGKMSEQSRNKDTTTGHWEIAGVVTDTPFPTYPEGFPPDIIGAFQKAIGSRIIGNYPRSGTAILEELGIEHLKTGYPIVYTSADSVFQIAAHQQIIALDRLYDYCKIARELLTGSHAVARVIARPFVGAPGHFERNNAARKDFSIAPPTETLLDRLKSKGLITVGIGKIGDIFGHRGLTEEIATRNNGDGVDRTLASIQKERGQRGLIFVNLVDFDMLYGHRRDISGYARALEAFDRRLPQLMAAMSDGDLLILTADHGCDPTYESHTDHTREYVPLLIHGKRIKKNVDLGTRATFADCGQSIADIFGVGPLNRGISFKNEII